MSKPSIYENQIQNITLIQHTNKLEELIRDIRLSLSDKFNSTNACANESIDKFIKFENDCKQQFNEVIDKNEKLSPSIFYIGVAALSGSIITKNRNFLLKLTLPPTLATLASYQLLPSSTTNAFNKLSNVEKTYLPDVHKQRLEYNQSIRDSFKDLRNKFNNQTNSINDLVSEGTTSLQNATGFRLNK